jgi:hypothetical protein
MTIPTTLPIIGPPTIARTNRIRTAYFFRWNHELLRPELRPKSLGAATGGQRARHVSWPAPCRVAAERQVQLDLGDRGASDRWALCAKSALRERESRWSNVSSRPHFFNFPQKHSWARLASSLSSFNIPQRLLKERLGHPLWFLVQVGCSRRVAI